MTVSAALRFSSKHYWSISYSVANIDRAKLPQATSNSHARSNGIMQIVFGRNHPPAMLCLLLNVDMSPSSTDYRISSRHFSISGSMLWPWDADSGMDVYNAYNAVYKLLSRIAELIIVRDYVRGSRDLSSTLYRHWKGECIGASLQLLRNSVRTHETALKSDRSYSKPLVFVQSKVNWKSRLADPYGTFCPMVTCVLRNDNSWFYLADKVILDAMWKSLI